MQLFLQQIRLEIAILCLYESLYSSPVTLYSIIKIMQSLVPGSLIVTVDPCNCILASSKNNYLTDWSKF